MNLTLDFHEDHKGWRSKLQFYQDEIRFFFKELNRVFDKDIENLARMEFIDEYEAILDKKSDAITLLMSRIQEEEKTLIEAEDPKSIARIHHQLHLDFIDFEASYKEMKKRFKRFASLND